MLRKKITRLKIQKVFYLALIVLILIVAAKLSYLSDRNFKQNIRNPVNILNIANKKIYNRYVKIENIKYISPYIKKISGDYENYSIYLICDNNENWYVLNWQSKELEGDLAELAIKCNIDEEPEKNYSIIGITREFPYSNTELKDNIANALNHIYNIHSINKYNVKEFIGDYIIETKDGSGANAFAIMVLGIMLTFFPELGYTYARYNYKKFTKVLKDDELELIEQELENLDTIFYPKTKIYLTRNYIISFKKNILEKYEDINKVMLHSVTFDLGSNGIFSEKLQTIRLEMKEKHKIMDILEKKKSNCKEFDEILKRLENKVQ